MARYSIDCKWCGENVSLEQSPLAIREKDLRNTLCPNCGSTVIFSRLDHERIAKVFPDGMPFCVCHDAAIEQGAQSSEP